MSKTFISKEINGIKYNILALPDTNLFKFEVVNKFGSNIERVIEKRGKNVYGISHFIEHLAFRATRDYTTKELNRLLRTKGTHNASTCHERINYWFKTTMDKRDVAISLVGNYAFNDLSKISEEEFNTEKKVVFNEAKRYADDDQTMFYFNTTPMVTGSHEQDNILGIPEVIDTFTIADAKYIKNIMLTHGETVFNVTYDPNVSHIDAITSEIEKMHTDFHATTPINPEADKIAEEYFSMLKFPLVCEHVVPNESDQAMTTLMFDVITDVRTAQIGNTYLAHYAENSSLNDIIREEHGLTYGIQLYNDQISYKEFTSFSCDVSKGDEELLLSLFTKSVNASVDAFNEDAYNALMDAVKLKQTMRFLNQESHDALHWRAIWQPKVMEGLSEEFATDIMSAYEALDEKYATFEQVKSYLKRMQEYVNATLYTKITN